MLRPGESKDLMMSDEGVRALLAPWTSSSDKEFRIERKATYRFAARSCERYRVGRVFLAGDAAHVTPPFVGQGLVSGLRDAANLSWKLAWVLTGRASTAILNSYDEERRPHAAKMIALARAMGQLVMPSTSAHALILHGAIKMLGHISMFRSFLDELGLKPRNSYPRGLFVAGKGALTRGAWFPQGLVRRAAGTIERSDDVLGSGFALVGLGADLAPSLDAPTARAWAAAGGTIVALSAGSHTAEGAVAAQALDERLLPRKAWGVVVRPDRTILHDGPAEAGNRIVREALEQIGANLARRAGGAQ
jgi:3-(3-hydroxy-phenyl)propionate hydroxylase